MKMAGASEEIFTPDACLEVFNFSSGYPRLINVICDFVLVAGYSRGLKKIDAGLIKECAQDLKVPINTEKAPIEPTMGQAMPQAQRPAPRPKQPGSFMYGAVFIVLVFMIFVGYQVYDSMSGRPGQWEPDDAAPQAQYRVLEEQRQAFNTEIEKEAGPNPNREGPAENDVPQNQGDVNTDALAALTLEESNLENVPQEIESKIVTSENASKSDSMETQPPETAVDQRSIIYFEHNSNELTPEAYETLNEIVKFTSRRPDLRITVEGFTDSYGNPNYNRQLSKYRAEVVKNYLIGHGVTSASITVIGRGPENPIENNKTFEGRKLNRRVEIQVNPIR
jgi:general secretion pathway protein A